MKTLLLFLFASYGMISNPNPINNTLETNDPDKKELNTSPLNTMLTIIEEINFKMNERDVALHVNKVNYNTESTNLSITANRNITFLQLVDENGAIDFQLPVFSETVTISLNDLEKGNWNLNIMIDNDTVIPASFSRL